MDSDIQILLSDILQYANVDIVNRYKRDFPGNSLSPENALEELLKFFWLSHKQLIDKEKYPNNEALKFSCAIHKEMAEIDDMWHTFLLFTKDYMNFCEKYFKYYIHHAPLSKNHIESKEYFINDLKKYLSYIYDNLGEETLIKWFANN